MVEVVVAYESGMCRGISTERSYGNVTEAAHIVEQGNN